MTSGPTLPPLLTGHAAPAEADLAAVVAEGVAAGRLGADDLVWSEARDVAAAAIVLEPEGSLAEALEMVPLTMVAVADALGAIGPPNLALMLRWPDVLTANGGTVGRVTISVPEGTSLDAVPAHVVVGFSIALTLPAWLAHAPGLDTETTALHEEGCGDIDRDGLIGAVARHFLSRLDEWNHGGFVRLRSGLAGRLSPEVGPRGGAAAGAMPAGRLVEIDEAGAARIEADGGRRVISLARALGIGA